VMRDFGLSQVFEKLSCDNLRDFDVLFIYLFVKIPHRADSHLCVGTIHVI
jgi:hypothetical protein